MRAPLTARARRSLVAGTGLMISGVLPAFLTASLASRIPEDFASPPPGSAVSSTAGEFMPLPMRTPCGMVEAFDALGR